MGMFWQYFSFPGERWRSLFDGSIPSAKKYFLAATWESLDPDLPDPESEIDEFLDFVWRTAPRNIVQIAEHVAQHGTELPRPY
jgi:hypothetical protein